MIALAPRAELEQAGLRLAIGSLVLVVLMCLTAVQTDPSSESAAHDLVPGRIRFLRGSGHASYFVPS